MQTRFAKAKFRSRYQRMLNWLRRIDWLAISTSAAVLVAALLFVRIVEPEDCTKVEGNGTGGASPKSSAVSPEGRIADYTEVLAYFTALLAIVSLFQGVMLYRSNNTATVSADAAKDAAKAAQLSADALTAIERAYVFLGKEITCQIDWPTTTGEERKSKIAIRFKNLGKTPAILKEIHWGVIRMAGAPNGVDAAKLPGGPLPVSIILSSGDASRQLTHEFSIQGKDVDSINLGREQLYLTGRVIYDDVFGKSHETGFCRMWRRKSENFDAGVSEKLNYYT